MENNIHHLSFQKFLQCTERRDQPMAQEIALLARAKVPYQSDQNRLLKILFRFSQNVFAAAGTSTIEPLYLLNMKCLHSRAEKRKSRKPRQAGPSPFSKNPAKTRRPRTTRHARLYQKIFDRVQSRRCSMDFLSELP